MILSLNQPDVRPVKESGKLYQVFTNYRFATQERDFLIKKGFRYNGANAPRFAWTLIGFLPDGVHRPAALVHDWLYTHGGRVLDADGVPFEYSRKDADRLFLKALEHVGVKSWHARLAYIAVRGFDWIGWGKQ